MGCSYRLLFLLAELLTKRFPQIKVVHSGNLFTGQNPASARQLAQEMLETLQGKA